MSNNALHNFGCPPLMNDGRHATDYRPSCYVHDTIIKQNGIQNSHQLRHFLQTNACQLAQINRDYFCQKASCPSCQYYHVDPNGNDRYWRKYKEYIGYDRLQSNQARTNLMKQV